MIKESLQTRSRAESQGLPGVSWGPKSDDTGPDKSKAEGALGQRHAERDDGKVEAEMGEVCLPGTGCPGSPGAARNRESRPCGQGSPRVMVDFMCRVDWAVGFPGSWLNLISGCVCERVCEALTRESGWWGTTHSIRGLGGSGGGGEEAVAFLLTV